MTPPVRRGFGATVLGRMVKLGLGCDAVVDFAPSGLAWRIDCAAETILDERWVNTPRLRTASRRARPLRRRGASGCWWWKTTR